MSKLTCKKCPENCEFATLKEAEKIVSSCDNAIYDDSMPAVQQLRMNNSLTLDGIKNK